MLQAHTSIKTLMPHLALEWVKVLVVDDDPNTCFFQAVTFEREGAVVFSVTSVQEAIRLFPDIQPHLVITDLQLPGKNGFDLLEYIQSQHSHRSIKVIAFTGFTDEAIRQRALAVGFDAYLTKPTPPDELIAAAKQLLDPTTRESS